MNSNKLRYVIIHCCVSCKMLDLYLTCVPTRERNLKGHVYKCSSSGTQALAKLHYILLRGSGNAVTHCLSREC
jgi:hypothetical protein